MTTPMPPGGNGSSPNSLTGSQSLLTLTDSQGNEVTFDFNPEKIEINHSTTNPGVPTVQANQNSPDGRRQVTHRQPPANPSPLSIHIGNLLLVGSDVASRCEQLLAWTVPEVASQQAQLPHLALAWGQLRFPQVKLTAARVSYQRFTAAGLPIRAQADLTMQRLDPPPLRTNPSSGGLPGRRSHIVVAGENLQHIATSAYGHPAAWRAIATANGIENPLRLRPGAVIYLPGPEEVAAGGRP